MTPATAERVSLPEGPCSAVFWAPGRVCYARGMSGIDATSTLIAGLLAGVAVLGTLFFWTIGAALLLTGNGGQINDMVLGFPMRSLFLAYPVFAVLALGSAGVAYGVGRYREALGFAGLPIVVLAGGYLLSTFVVV